LWGLLVGLMDRLLVEAGTNRQNTYVTSIVKHFQIRAASEAVDS
jgi:hypothetical protein